MFKKYITIILFLCLLSITLGCTTVYNPITQREELTLIDTSSEKALGANVANQIELNNKLVHDSKVLSRVRKIGNSIAAQSGRQDINYRFNVIDDIDEVNAVSLPGGYIYIFSGLIEEANNDELACVIAHEVGHVEARHAVKRLQAALGYRLLMSLAFKGEQYADIARYSNTMFNLIAMGYSRQDELEADRVAARYAHKAGYDPFAMITFLNKLKELDEYSSHRIEFLSTHPLIENRISMLEREIEELKSGEGR